MLDSVHMTDTGDTRELRAHEGETPPARKYCRGQSAELRHAVSLSPLRRLLMCTCP